MGFTPSERPRLAVAIDGTLAAIHEPARIAVVELPGIAAFAEIGIDPATVSSDVAWIGMPPRLLVVSRYASHSIAHLVDPSGPRTIAEIRLETPMKLFGTTGNHALVVGGLGAAVLTASESHLTPYQFPARAVPVAAGASGNQFVVALPSAIEEWDPAARMPKRRLKLPRPSVITALGGTERVVWLTTQHDPARIDVIPLVNRGQPKSHELPEPIAQVTAHPRMDLLACVGADTGRLYILDLDGRTGMRIVGPPGIARVESAALVVGRMLGVLAAQANHAVALVSLDGREQPEAAAPAPAAPPKQPEPPPVKSTLFDDDDAPVETPTVVVLQTPPEDPAKPPQPSLPSLFRPPAPPAAPPPAKPAPVAPPVSSVLSTSERLTAWRESMRDASSTSIEVSADRRPTWRDRAASWYRAVAAGADVREAPSSISIGQLVARLDLPPELQPALVLLYGAHLAGEGAAPIDIARVLDRNWAEALGRGELARRGIAAMDGSRVHLTRAIQRTLDELPPETGTLVGDPGIVTLLGPCAVVADPGAALPALAERFRTVVGCAILVGDTVTDAMLFEAAARGAVSMVRAHHVIEHPVILVADSEHDAEALGVPRID
jgi:hypothetical protein